MTTNIEKVMYDFFSNPTFFVRQLQYKDNLLIAVLSALLEKEDVVSVMSDKEKLAQLVQQIEELKGSQSKCTTLEDENRVLAAAKARLEEQVKTQTKVLSQINNDLKKQTGRLTKKRQQMTPGSWEELTSLEQSIKEIDMFLSSRVPQ
jgi:septal ring factor EnvC (AmiA/AmiB activator)